VIDACRPDHLAHRDRFGQALQLPGAERADLVGVATAGQGLDQVADEDLTAVGHRTEPRGLDDRRAEPVAVLEGGVAGADADPHRQCGTVGPTVVAIDRTLHGHGPGQGVGRSRVRRHHRVADGLDLGAAGGRHGLAQRGEVGATQVVGGDVADVRGEVRRADEVGEQDDDQPRTTHRLAPSCAGRPTVVGAGEGRTLLRRERVRRPCPLGGGPGRHRRPGGCRHPSGG